MQSGYADIDQNICKQCGLCAEVCPQGAIVEVKPVLLTEFHIDITDLKRRADNIIARIDALRNNQR